MQTQSRGYLPANHTLHVRTDVHLLRELQERRPLDDLLVRIARVLRAEGRPADEALEEDGTEGPPVAFLSVAFLDKDLWSNVVWRADGGVCLRTRTYQLVTFGLAIQVEKTHKLSSVGFPGGDLLATHGEVNRVHLYTVP